MIPALRAFFFEDLLPFNPPPFIRADFYILVYLPLPRISLVCYVGHDLFLILLDFSLLRSSRTFSSEQRRILLLFFLSLVIWRTARVV